VSTSRLLLSREAPLTTNNVRKALYFEERARKAKDLMRRERFHRRRIVTDLPQPRNDRPPTYTAVADLPVQTLSPKADRVAAASH